MRLLSDLGFDLAPNRLRIDFLGPRAPSTRREEPNYSDAAAMNDGPRGGPHASASDPLGLEESRVRGMSDSSEPRRSAVTSFGDAPRIRC
jgi:hypothetical protein